MIWLGHLLKKCNKFMFFDTEKGVGRSERGPETLVFRSTA